MQLWTINKFCVKMGVFDLNKVTITMGEILLQLPELEEVSQTWFSIDNNKEFFYAMAYKARVSIMDIIERNPYMRNGALEVVIPLGIFKTRKETMADALEITIGRILELARDHDEVYQVVSNILERGNLFYELERNLAPEVIKAIKKI